MLLPSLSVIVPNYNHAHYLPQCLNAMLGQSVQAKEIIVIDDASTDNSVEVLTELAKRESSIKLLKNEKNMGNLVSNLKGWEYATGDFILLAAADDYLLPGFFKNSLELLAKYPQAGLCSGLSKRINEHGDYIDTVPEPPYLSNTPSYISPQKMLDAMINRDNWTVMPTVALINRKLANDAKAFTADPGRYIDGFVVVLMALNYGACFIPKEMGVHRILPDSGAAQSRKKPKAHLQDVAPIWKLMETSYAEKFPPNFRKHLKRLHLYQYGSMAANQLDEFLGGFVDDLKIALENPSILDRLFFQATRFFGKLQCFMTRAYLFIRLRKFNTDILLRIIYRIKNRLTK